MEGLGIEIAGTFVEQAGDHVADAGLAGRVLGRAAAEGIFHRDQGHGGVLHEPGLDAAGRDQALDFRGGMRRRRCQQGQRDAGGNDGCEARRANCKAGHERFSSRFGAVGILDQIAGHRTLLVEPFLRGVADLFGGDGADAIRPASDVVDAKPGGERAAIPARQRRLVVLGVDRFRDQLGLDPLEILGAGGVLDHVRDHAVDRLLDLRKLDAGLRRDRDRELRRIERGALIAGAGADRERTVDHQRAVEIGVGAAAHQLRQHVERRAFAGGAVVDEGTR